MTTIRASIVVSMLALGACGSSPESVCEHIEGLVAAELSPEEAAKFDGARCAEDIERQRGLVGSTANKGLECLMAADSLSAIDQCEREAEEKARQAKGGD